MAFDLGSVIAKVDLDVSAFKKGIQEAQTGVNSLGKRLDTIGSDLKKFGQGWSLFVTTPIVGAGALALKSAADFEQLQVALKTILGSEEQAVKLLAQMQEFAKTTPFEFTELAEATKQLLAYGFAQDEILGTSRMLGDVASGLNIRFGDLAYLYGTLRAQQVAYTKDMNQFANRGIPIWEELSKVMGMTVPQVRDLVEQGKVGFADVEQAFKNMTGEGGKFHDLMQAQSQTTAGQFSNLKDSVGFLARDIGELLLPTAIDLISKLRDLVDWVNGLSEDQKKLIIVIAAVVAAIGPLLLVLGTLVSGISAVITIVGALGTALTFLMANPISLLIIAIVALYVAWRTNFLGIRDITDKIVNWFKDLWNSLPDFVRDVGGRLFDQLLDPFRRAWDGIQVIVKKIKDALDFTQRHSPSVVDIVSKGVDLVNKELAGLQYNMNMTPEMAAGAMSNQTTGPSIYNVKIDLAGAIIADDYSADRMAEKIGDSFIRKLQQNVRF